MSKIAFMGDSITAYMPYVFKGVIGKNDDEVNYYGIENIGVGTYMNYYWPRVEQKDIDTYILLIGTNNISRPDCDYDKKESLDELIEKLKTFISRINDSGNSRLLVQSIYPTKYVERVNSIKMVNAQVKQYCLDIGVEYLDVYEELADDNELFDEKYTNDGIHPNEAGYGVIAELINKKLERCSSNKMLQKKTFGSISE